MVQIEFPDYWSSERLEDVCEILNGSAFDSSEFTEDKSKGIPVIRIGDLGTGKTELNHTGDYEERYIVSQGDYLISMDRHFHIYSWQGDAALLNQRVCKIHSIDERLHDEFLKFYLELPLQNIKENVEYTTVPHLSMKELRNIEVPLPPLDEQKRIANKLSSIFESMEEIRDMQAKADEIENTILQSCISKQISNAGIKRFGDCVESSLYGYTSKSGEEVDGVPYLRITDIDDTGTLPTTPPKKVEISEEDYRKYQLDEGDIVVARSGATSGKCYVYTEEDGEMVYASYLIRFSLDTSKILPGYVHYYFRSKEYWTWVERTRRKSAQSNINAGEIKDLELPVPPIAEQRQIVKYLNGVEEKLNRIRNCSSQKDQLLSELPRAIRLQAFTGELFDDSKKADTTMDTRAQASLNEF